MAGEMYLKDKNMTLCCVLEMRELLVMLPNDLCSMSLITWFQVQEQLMFYRRGEMYHNRREDV